tara:strand:+ start:188 stop:2389 length:2202 start_codon:yes stop_codon:yes gene_type:complete
MPNLVGIGLSQVPTNSMLGGMAYQDPEHASIKNLDLEKISQINAEIPQTARGLFIYDTSKDSDGGAWRKRTQHTSWYNETLATTTRGTRKEFPAVAVIVFTQDKLYIHDADDPTLPMWMVFEFNQYPNGGNLAGLPVGLGHVSSSPLNVITISSVYMMNGLLFIGGNQQDNASAVHAGWSANFLSEELREYLAYPVNDNEGAQEYRPTGNIALRNSAEANNSVPSNRYDQDGIHDDNSIQSFVNDVVMTVLPDAPIDNTMGIPRPTIALACGNTNSNAQSKGVSFIMDDGTFVHGSSSSGAVYGHSNTITITEDGYFWWTGDSYNSFQSYRDSWAMSVGELRPLAFNSSDFTWSNSADTLSGTVRTPTNYYVVSTGSESGRIKIGPGNDWQWYIQRGNALGGSVGFAKHKVFGIGGNSIRMGLSARITTDYNTGYLCADHEGKSAARATLMETNTTANLTSSIDDRSINNNAFTVQGTITRSPVAPGAELVAYSGWSASNYINQSTSGESELTFGTNPFYVMCWFKMGAGTNRCLWMRRSGGGSQDWRCEFGTSRLARLYFNANGNTIDAWSKTIFANEETWHFGIWQKGVGGNNRTGRLFIDGKLDVQATAGGDLNMTEEDTIAIGQRSDGASSEPWDGYITMFRIGRGEITENVAAYIYEQEKALFNPNAKCTIYGGSSAVTGLAYDEVTKQYHVGTSAGRSDFQGLCRINNTTTAVTTAISAHDGFIVEQ